MGPLVFRISLTKPTNKVGETWVRLLLILSLLVAYVVQSRHMGLGLKKSNISAFQKSNLTQLAPYVEPRLGWSGLKMSRPSWQLYVCMERERRERYLPLWRIDWRKEGVGIFLWSHQKLNPLFFSHQTTPLDGEVAILALDVSLKLPSYPNPAHNINQNYLNLG